MIMKTTAYPSHVGETSIAQGLIADVLSELGPKDMVLCDLEGNRLEAPDGVTQCYEVKMHSCIYRAFADVKAVVHAHPRAAFRRADAAFRVVRRLRG